MKKVKRKSLWCQSSTCYRNKNVLRQLIRVLPFQPSLKNQCYTIETRSERNQRYYNELENKSNQMVQQNKKSQQVFNKAKSYRLKPLLKRALKQMPSFPHHQRTFEYYDISVYLAKYIKYNKHDFIDPRNKFIVWFTMIRWEKLLM